MAKSLLDQDFAIRGSLSYDDAVASVHTVGVAEGQSNLEGDLNVLRTLVKESLGVTNWYDLPSSTLGDISGKQFQCGEQPAGFLNVASGTGTSSLAWDTAIKTITNHANGAGSSTVEGVILDTTYAHKLVVRRHSNQDAITDGSGNEVYARLAWTGTQYRLDWFSWQSGAEVAYNFTASVNLDLAEVLVSRSFEDLPWAKPYAPSFHDTSGVTGVVADDSVVVDGMTDLLSGLTTQAAVNAKVDDLGSTTASQGASLIAINDASAFYTGTDVEAALNELEALLGAATSSTYNFTENNVLADNDAVYAALEKLDLQWGDLASTANGEGASLVGIEDVGGYTTETTVEGALQDIYSQLATGTETKVIDDAHGVISAGANYTLPGSLTYTLDAANGQNLDVFVQGQLLFPGLLVNNDDYEEVSTTQIKFLNTIPAGRNLIFVKRG